jgi:hypothetical protein
MLFEGLAVAEAVPPIVLYLCLMVESLAASTAQIALCGVRVVLQIRKTSEDLVRTIQLVALRSPRNCGTSFSKRMTLYSVVISEEYLMKSRFL